MVPSQSTITVIGSVGAVLTTGAFVPQVIRVWRLKDARDISLPMLLLFSIGLIVWMVYGILIPSVPIIIANALTLMLALTILVLKVKFDRAAHYPAS